jgi:hypothetical protein
VVEHQTVKIIVEIRHPMEEEDELVACFSALRLDL